MINIDLDDEFINLFYSITGNKKIPETLNLKELKSQLINILELFRDLNSAVSSRQKRNLNIDNVEEETTHPAILVIDDLGVIIYQLKTLFSNFNYDIDCSQEIYDAINKFKKRKYDYVVMDLFIPTEREGYILLSELRKMASMNNSNTIIGVMTAANQKNIENTCKNRGADFFIEKNNDWQKNLYKIMDEYINSDAKQDNY